VQTQITKDGSALNYYPHHIGDYLRDTAHLTPLEDGIYRRMLDVYYASEKPLPVETQWVCRLVRARTTEEQSAVDEVLRQFFSKHPDGWRNKRADNEIRKGRARVKAARTNGKSGGRPKTQRVSKNNPVGGLDVNPDQSSQKPKAKSQKEDKEGALALPAWVPEDAWKAWLQVRPKVKAPNTPEALRLALRDLDRLRGEGNDPRAVLEAATMKGWRGLFPVGQAQQAVKVDL
jgi:uncharacterized protein YdaU (DUF1376 family)